MHTFFISQIPEISSEAQLDRRERDHLFKTLRCRAGEKLQLCDGHGTTALAEATADRTVRILEIFRHQPDAVRIHLYAALPKNAKLDCLLKPAAEAGAVSITPLKCRYSVAEKDTPPERWHLLLEEACKQSGNPFLPELCPGKSVSEAIEECQKLQRPLFFGAQHGVFLAPEDFPSDAESLDLAWFVGPEGGFDEAEQALLAQAGQGISVGPYIFRLENAALAGIAYLGTTARAGRMKK